MPQENENLFDFFSSLLNDNNSKLSDLAKSKELLSQLANWAGKGKDEFVNMIIKEIGSATAAILTEHLKQALEENRLRLTVELVPREDREK